MTSPGPLQMRNSRSSRESSILSTEDASSYKSRCTEEGEEEEGADEDLGCNGSSSLSSGQSPPATGIQELFGLGGFEPLNS